MEIKVVAFNEETGHVELELDSQAQAELLNAGFNAILKKFLDNLEEQPKAGTNIERP